MKITNTYDANWVTGEEAISHIKSGQRVFISHCSAEPGYLVNLLAEKKENYENVEIVQLMPLGAMPLAEKGMEKHFHYNSIFVGGATRNAVADGRAYFHSPVQLPFKSYSNFDIAQPVLGSTM